MRQQAFDLGRQRVEIIEVIDADGPATGLVLVGGADAALGGADLGPARSAALAQGVELAMHREDQGRIVGDAQGLAGNLDALFAQPLDFGHQSMRVEHHAVADDAELVLLRTTPEGRSDSL